MELLLWMIFTIVIALIEVSGDIGMILLILMIDRMGPLERCWCEYYVFPDLFPPSHYLDNNVHNAMMLCVLSVLVHHRMSSISGTYILTSKS